ncbi:DUF3631 domain-containing protein [Janthinobacterium sp. SUN033]|uniref:DUF3631 domain-containing protein n=1 Tax=Janthinobacterium sp. SUN033 TaxID=3002439 RepID=UPI0025AEF1DE|nr:DUF3631 domain-containing protein [Janthinobacterium sp. SUN033]MDN2677662.1 DUF3631 domain-containing protein [Janthinobacterium sp. SUN033]
MFPKTHSPFEKNTDIKGEWQEVDDIASCLASVTNNGPKPNYLKDHGLVGIPTKIYNSIRHIGGINCDGATALLVLNADFVTVNLLVMVKNSFGYYEDVFFPGANLSSCFGLIGNNCSNTIIIVDNYPAGLALHKATSYGVAVALYADNLMSVAIILKRKYSDRHFVIGAANYHGGEDSSSLPQVLAAAISINARVALPNDVLTFDEQYRVQGPHSIKDSINNAVDASMIEKKATSQDISVIPPRPSPWPNMVNGEVLMEHLVKTISKHVVMSSEAVIAMALWVMFTYVIDLFQYSPILLIRSPIKGCGKTSVIRLLVALVAKPFVASNITPAVVYRFVDEWYPTLLLDEADTYLNGNGGLTGIINSGHSRTASFVTRMEGNKIKNFNTFCAKAFAGIGIFPDTIMDRGISILLQRKLPTETVEQYIPAANDEFVALRAQIIRCMTDLRSPITGSAVGKAGLNNDRHEDNWEPLLRIAHCLGGKWPERAKNAARTLSITHDETKCGGEEILRDIQVAFRTSTCSKMRTGELIAKLSADAEKPWGTFTRGKAITPREVAKLLADFDIESKNLRFGTEVVKGYELAQFDDAFARYVRDDVA